MHPQSPSPCTGSWRQSFCSGWRYSASSALPGMQSRRCKSPRIHWRCVEFLNLMPWPKLLRLYSGVTNARPGQRLFPFHNRILRDHQHILFTYLSLGARGGPKEFTCTETVRVARPPFRPCRVWSTDVVGCEYHSHNASLFDYIGRMVTM